MGGTCTLIPLQLSSPYLGLKPRRGKDSRLFISLETNRTQFQDERYILVEQSQFFPGFDLNTIFSECISDAYQFGSGAIDKLSVSVAAP
jgi:hypothetical protein